MNTPFINNKQGAPNRQTLLIFRWGAGEKVTKSKM
jgi:hypothetical protein